jgi:NAD(P)-dependent dehydrogenase (short-subunit alcohol dehydrogenase family)
MESILDKFGLKGKVALITGAARGLGQAMALGLGEAGADIMAVDQLDCSETWERISGLGRKCETLAIDLAASGAPEMTIAKTIESLGSIDILVNNAGIIRRAPFLEFSEKDWDDVMNLNIKAVFLLSQAAARQMALKGKGAGSSMSHQCCLSREASWFHRMLLPRARWSGSLVSWHANLLPRKSIAMPSLRATWRPRTLNRCVRIPCAAKPYWIASLRDAGASRKICKGLWFSWLRKLPPM